MCVSIFNNQETIKIMEYFSPEAFKNTIDNYGTFEEFCEENLDAQNSINDLQKQSHWLIYLVIKERLDDIREFLSEMTDEYRIELLNLPTDNGNILHEVCYWCNNNNGFTLFRIFLTCGARIIRNNTNRYPNELNNTRWIYNGYIVRPRNPMDFNFINLEVFRIFNELFLA